MIFPGRNIKLARRHAPRVSHSPVGRKLPIGIRVSLAAGGGPTDVPQTTGHHRQREQNTSEPKGKVPSTFPSRLLLISSHNKHCTRYQRKNAWGWSSSNYTRQGRKE